MVARPRISANGAADGARGAAPDVGEGAERVGPVGGLRDQLGALLAQRGHDPRLDGGRVDGGPRAAVVAPDHQADVDEQLERGVQLAARSDARVGGVDAS